MRRTSSWPGLSRDVPCPQKESAPAEPCFQDGAQAVEIMEQQVGAFVCGEPPRKPDGQRVKIQ